MSTPTEEYVTARVEQAIAAGKQRNGELLVGIIELIRSDGFPEFADALTRELVEQGLANLAKAART